MNKKLHFYLALIFDQSVFIDLLFSYYLLYNIKAINYNALGFLNVFVRLFDIRYFIIYWTFYEPFQSNRLINYFNDLKF